MSGAERREENRRLISPQQRYGARLQSRSSEALQTRLISRETENLGVAFAGITDSGSVAQAAAIIVAARRRFITGSGKSLAYAHLLAHDLSAGLSQVALIDGTVVRALDVLSDVRDSDVLVAFSLRRYRRDTVRCCEEFAAAGGTVVAITDDEEAPLVKLAAQSIVVSTASASYADSPTAVAAVVHVLSALSTASAKGARRRLAERDRISSDLGLYWEG